MQTVGLHRQQPRSRETPSPQQLREWYAGRGRSGGAGPCTYVLRTGGRCGETCGLQHTAQRCFGRLTNAWRAQFPDAVELSRWGEQKQNVAIFDLDFDTILAAMYAVTDSGRHLATFTRRPGSSLYTLTTASPPVTSSYQVAASSQVFAAASRSSPASPPCSCCPLSHENLLWHHRLGHPSLPRLRGMASRTLVSGLPRCLPPLPQGPAPTCVPCVEGRQRAAPYSSTFPPTEAPLQTLHMDVKGDVTEVLIDSIRGARHQLSERFGSDLPVLRLHSERGGEFSSDLLRAFCRAEGICQTYTLPASPQQNGIAERRIGMVMEVARTFMIHAAAPHFMWLFAVQYAAHQINLQPRVSLPETTPTLRWMGKVGDASVFRVWGSRAFVRDTSADKLSSRAVPCVFLGFPPDAPGWQFYHPNPRRVLSSQDVTFEESVSYYRLFPYRTASFPPPPLFLAPGVSQVDLAEPDEVDVDSGAARGGEPAGAETGGAEFGGTEPNCVEPGGAESVRAEPGGAEPARAESGGSPGVPLRWEPLSPQQLCEWYARRCRGAARHCRGAAGVGGAAGAAGGATGAAGGAPGAGSAGGAAGAGAAVGAAGGATGAGAAGGAVGARADGGAAGAGAAGAAGGTGAVGGPGGSGAAGGAVAAGPGGARTGGTGAAGTGGAAGVVAGDPGAEGAGAVSIVSGGAAQPRP
ncbi:unnamed protein product [Closterium sp. NIES-54]